MQQDISDDEEFYDAVGSMAEIEEMKARLEHPHSFSHFKAQSTTNTNSKSHSHFPAYSSPTLKRDENENTLTISEREANYLRDTQNDRNLQQILDKLDENSAYISSEQSALTGGKFKVEESPSKRAGSHAKLKLPLVSSPPASKQDDGSGHSKGSTPKSSTRSKSSSQTTNSPSKVHQKRSFLSFISRKNSGESEYAKENLKLHNKNSSNFQKLICLQNVEDDKKAQQQLQESTSKKSKNSSATWIAKFSPDCRYLATGGSDGLLKVYSVTILEPEENGHDSFEANLQILDSEYISLVGHKGDIIDISWFKNSKMLITCAVDKMVILWNVEGRAPVKIFEHSDIVSCLSFHPLVDEFFATGCFDKMIRIWDINETKVVDWVQTTDIITAMTFSPDKNHLLVGFYKGTVKIYRTDQGKLKFMMEIVCKNSFAWGKINKVGKKVTGIIFTEDYEFLVMTNDSRMRLIDMNTYETKMKYKGHTSGKYHIQPSYNYEKEMILSGSEDEKVYIWNKISDYVPQINPIYSFQKANRNTSYESFKPFPKNNTTCAIWVPFTALQKYREKVLSVWKDVYVDNLMVLFSSDSKIKVLGDMIELNAEQNPKDKKGKSQIF